MEPATEGRKEDVPLSRVLGRILRKIAAVTAYAGFRVYAVWIPTDDNPADPPSRGAALLRVPGPRRGVLWPPEVLDLIDRMLVYDHVARILPREALFRSGGPPAPGGRAGQ